MLRDFFTFALTGLAGETVTSATLSLGQFDSQSDSGRATEQYALYGVSIAPTTLDDTNGTSAEIYNAPAAGTSYGSFSVPVSGFGTDSFALNAAGIAAAIAGGAASFSIGGSLAFPAAIPEPISSLSISAGLLGLGFARRRRAA